MKSRVWIGLGAAATLFFNGALAHVQAGMEAGAITSHSAGLAKKPQETGSTTTTSTTRTQGAVGGSKIVNGKPVATTLPERRVRPASGAPGAISGQVLEHGSGKPVKDVLVRLVSTEPQYVVETKL